MFIKNLKFEKNMMHNIEELIKEELKEDVLVIQSKLTTEEFLDQILTGIIEEFQASDFSVTATTEQVIAQASLPSIGVNIRYDVTFHPFNTEITMRYLKKEKVVDKALFQQIHPNGYPGLLILSHHPEHSKEIGKMILKMRHCENYLFGIKEGTELGFFG